MIYADQRWIGNHGIGRFAREVLAKFEYAPIPSTIHPAAPLDAWRLAHALKEATPQDLFFSPGYNTPLFCACPVTFTIHDLSHVYCPENTSPAIQLYYATVMKRACRRAARIFTVSEFTRSQIIEWSGVVAESVCNVGCGVDAAYRPDGDVYELPYPYLLCVSNRKRHKNEFRIIEAFSRAAIDRGIHLVFTGEPTNALSRWLRKQNLSDRISFIGEVQEERLPSLYRGAVALLFVSLYEGFGLPLLEAMACGTPVLTSNVTAMPETAGDAALLASPTSVESITDGILEIVNNGGLRADLREQGLRRSVLFSWTKVRDKVQSALTNMHDSAMLQA